MKTGSKKRPPTRHHLRAGGRRGCPLPLDGIGDIFGVRPSAAAISCLRESLRREADAVETRRTAAADVIRCVGEAQRTGATLTAVATALIGPRSTISETIKARKRLANAIACRLHAARQRQR
jgi:hypothetical protein